MAYILNEWQLPGDRSWLISRLFLSGTVAESLQFTLLAKSQIPKTCKKLTKISVKYLESILIRIFLKIYFLTFLKFGLFSAIHSVKKYNELILTHCLRSLHLPKLFRFCFIIKIPSPFHQQYLFNFFK